MGHPIQAASHLPHRYPTHYQHARQQAEADSHAIFVISPSVFHLYPLREACVDNSRERVENPMAVANNQPTFLLGVLLPNDIYGYLCADRAKTIVTIRRDRHIDIQTCKRRYECAPLDYHRFNFLGLPEAIASGVVDMTDVFISRFSGLRLADLLFCFSYQALYSLHLSPDCLLKPEAVFTDFNIMLAPGEAPLPNSTESLVRIWAPDLCTLGNFCRFYFHQLVQVREQLPPNLRNLSITFEPENIDQNFTFFQQNLDMFPWQPIDLNSRFPPKPAVVKNPTPPPTQPSTEEPGPSWNMGQSATYTAVCAAVRQDVYNIDLSHLFIKGIVVDGRAQIPINLFHKIADIERINFPSTENACRLHNMQPTAYEPALVPTSPGLSTMHSPPPRDSEYEEALEDESAESQEAAENAAVPPPAEEVQAVETIRAMPKTMTSWQRRSM